MYSFTLTTKTHIGQGGYLADQNKVTSIWLKEFKLEPLPTGTPMNDFLVDGDPMAPSKIHVKVIPGGLTVFAPPAPPPERALDIVEGRWIHGIMKVDKPDTLPVVYESDDVLALAEEKIRHKSSVTSLLRSKAEKELNVILNEARALGKQLREDGVQPRRILCLYNPVSGGG